MSRNERKVVLSADNKRAEIPAVNFRVGRLQNFSQLVNLSESVYGFLQDNSSDNYYRWQYEKNPNGSAIVGTAESGGEFVGHYGLVPIRIWVEGHEGIAGLGVNAMTRRDFQGRAIFVRLVALVNEKAARQGMEMTYVVPSPHSEPWFIKVLGFTEWSPLPLWVRPLRLIDFLQSFSSRLQSASSIMKTFGTMLPPLLGVMPTRRNPYSVEIRTISEFGPEFDVLWEQAKGHLHFSIMRTCEYLRWRFNAVPTWQYQIWGAIIKVVSSHTLSHECVNCVSVPDKGRRYLGSVRQAGCS